MTETVLSSPNKEVVIGFDRPFVIIGERINPTGRKVLASEMAAGDYSRVEADAITQVEAGAHMLDVNAGIPLADEPRILAETVQLVQTITDVPLAIDSSIVAALEAGLSVYQGKALVIISTFPRVDDDRKRSIVLPVKYDGWHASPEYDKGPERIIPVHITPGGLVCKRNPKPIKWN